MANDCINIIYKRVTINGQLSGGILGFWGAGHEKWEFGEFINGVFLDYLSIF